MDGMGIGAPFIAPWSPPHKDAPSCCLKSPNKDHREITPSQRYHWSFVDSQSGISAFFKASSFSSKSSKSKKPPPWVCRVGFDWGNCRLQDDFCSNEWRRTKALGIYQKLKPCWSQMYVKYMCHGQKSPYYIGDGHPTFNRNPYNGYINPYYWVDDHLLLYGNNGSLDPGTCKYCIHGEILFVLQAIYFLCSFPWDSLLGRSITYIFIFIHLTSLTGVKDGI